MKLRNLLNLTEFAPSAPVPAPVLPNSSSPSQQPQGMNAGGEAPVDNNNEPAPPDDDATSPTPDNPAEYDFTKDFREFEDKKNKAESDAKKALMEKMNEKLLNKTIVANASRGYGQPKTDYTINNVKKISVEFWYKDYVVIALDENDKKYFLTPGINIKIESNGGENGEKSASASASTASTAPIDNNDNNGQEGGEEETPNNNNNNSSAPAQPQQGQQTPSSTENPNQQQPQTAAKPQQQQTPLAPSAEEDPTAIIKKKKKIQQPMTEIGIQKDLNTFLTEFMSTKVKNSDGNVNFFPYMKDATKMLTEGNTKLKIKCQLLIPENHMVNNVDCREIKLSAVDSLRKTTSLSSGQYSKGSIDIVKNGRYYILEYVKEIGRNI